MSKFSQVAFCSLIVMMACGESQSQKETSDTIDSNTGIKLHVDTSYSYDDFKESVTKPYVDSLNAFQKGSKLPSFLMDPDLDFASKINDWPNSNFVSFREEVFKRVVNLEVLHEIVQNPYFEHHLQNIENRRMKIPSDNISTYTLALERLAELKD
jgi:hypothetical protein